MTISEAKAKCRALGFSLRKKDGEYRLNLVGGTEATAYYTNDLDDAVGTAEFEAARTAGNDRALQERLELVVTRSEGRRTSRW